MKSIQLLDPCTSPHWMEFVNRHPDATIFHHPVWLRMLKRTYGYRTFAICIEEQDKIVAGIPFMEVRSFITGNRWLALPFSDHCQPLLAANGAESSQRLLEYLGKDVGGETPTIEIRWRLAGATPAYYLRTFTLHTLSLMSDPNEVFSRFKKTRVQQPIMKAERQRVAVKECKDLKEFEAFYSLQLLSRKRLGVPAQPKRFFRALWECLLEKGHGFALLAMKNGRPIGGGVFLRFNKKMTYKYAASDYAFRSLKPSDIILWEAIRRACEEGDHTFDFGRTERANTGLREFKSGWGTNEADLDYTILSDRPPQSRSLQLEKLGSAIIRNSPRFVCRLSGELLYRHFA